MAFLTITSAIWILIALVAVFLIAGVIKKVSGILIKICAVVFLVLLAVQFLR